VGWVGRGEGGMRACAARGVGPQEGAQRGGGGRRGWEHVAQQHLVCLVQRTRVDAPVDAPVERRHVLGVRVAAAACVCARAREACRGAAGGGAARPAGARRGAARDIRGSRAARVRASPVCSRARERGRRGGTHVRRSTESILSFSWSSRTVLPSRFFFHPCASRLPPPRGRRCATERFPSTDRRRAPREDAACTA